MFSVGTKKWRVLRDDGSKKIKTNTLKYMGEAPPSTSIYSPQYNHVLPNGMTPSTIILVFIPPVINFTISPAILFNDA